MIQNFSHVKMNFEELETEKIDGDRHYILSDGQRLPSVTSVLSILSKDSIIEWRRKVGEEVANRISRKAASRGTKTHTLIESYLKNEELNLGKTMPDAIEMFSSIRKAIDGHITKIYGIEIPLYSKELGIAGRCDCVAEYDGEVAIVDWKTSTKKKSVDWIESYILQATAYSIMFEELTGVEAKIGIIVIGVDGESFPQVFRVYTKDNKDRLLEVIQMYHDNKINKSIISPHT